MIIFTASAAKVVGLGFLCGLIGSWLLTSSTSSYVGQFQSYPSWLKSKIDALDVQSFNHHDGHHEGILNFLFPLNHYARDETLLVDEMAKVRPVFAFIFTSAAANQTRAAHIKLTWAQRFNGYLFFSDSNDSGLPAIGLRDKRGWALTRSAIAHVYDNFGQNFTFFMKAHDTNYVVVENLRALLLKLDFNEPLLIGRLTEATQNTTKFMSDESGYVMSRAALEHLAMGIKSNAEACGENDAAVDANLDQEKADLFHPLSPSETMKLFLQATNPDKTFNFDKATRAFSCCSDRSVTFSNIKGADLYMMEYMTYHLYPYGIIREPENYENLSEKVRRMNRLSHSWKHRSKAQLFLIGVLTGIVVFGVHFSTLQFRSECTKKEVIDLANFVVTHNNDDSCQLYRRVGSLTLAEHLAKRVRVFAAILTTPPAKMVKAIHVKMTWARRFNGYVFVSSEDDIYLPSIKAIDEESRTLLWAKIRQAMVHIYTNSLNDYDFFLKADDDTYVIVENLRFFLSNRDPNVPTLMGRRFNYSKGSFFPSGGSGYVLSRAALKMIVEGILNGTSACAKSEAPEDVQLDILGPEK
ncbi:unnamed protein product [Hydatigera taeniaeformis]|uniref:N-acetylgalactosaminide beta-1,3-galactosyltransferase n=1 Tax=Hydatigena taeniaeformis TaxID=6205 RepID=A0A0R3WKC4_HYDTA|nr:unnamed protein product [Hydatigera taeniaeformis]